MQMHCMRQIRICFKKREGIMNKDKIKFQQLICFKCSTKISKGLGVFLTVCVNSNKSDNRRLPAHKSCYDQWWIQYANASDFVKKDMDAELLTKANKDGLPCPGGK